MAIQKSTKNMDLRLESEDTESILRTINNFPFAMVYQVIMKKDGTRKLKYVSESVKRFYGVTQQEAIDDVNIVYRSMHEGDRERVHMEEEMAKDTMSVFKSEVRMKDPYGGIRWSYFISIPRELQDGSICWDGIEFDITEQKKAQEALKASENIIRSVANNLVSGMIYQVVRRKDGSRRFTYISESVERLYGVSAMAAMENAELIYGRVHKDDQKRLYLEEEKANESMSVFKTEARIVGPTGNIRWSCFVSQPTRLDDGSTRWDGIEMDITNLKKAEEDLKIKIKEMEKFQDITMGREERIIELKEEIKKLKAEIEKLKAAKLK